MTETLRNLCLTRTWLREEDILLLEQYEVTLPATANLMRGDVFIDCLDRNGCAFVAAHAMPEFLSSSYSVPVCGKPALFHNEPVVYHAFSEGIPFHGSRANTQENKTVRQDVIPIKKENGHVIGVLIAEQDISREVEMEKKMDALANSWQGAEPIEYDPTERLLMREAHHRIKNNLQLISGLCSLKSMEAQSHESKGMLMDISGIILSVSMMHDLLSDNLDQPAQKIFLPALLSKVIDGVRSFIILDQSIEISLQCENVLVNSDCAVYIALVVNELISNAIEHGCVAGKGKIKIELISGARFSTIIVTDNGCGMPPEAKLGTGLSIVSDIVRERLKGDLNFASDSNGAKASFSFTNGASPA